MSVAYKPSKLSKESSVLHWRSWGPQISNRSPPLFSSSSKLCHSFAKKSLRRAQKSRIKKSRYRGLLPFFTKKTLHTRRTYFCTTIVLGTTLRVCLAASLCAKIPWLPRLFLFLAIHLSLFHFLFFVHFRPDSVSRNTKKKQASQEKIKIGGKNDDNFFAQ